MSCNDIQLIYFIVVRPRNSVQQAAPQQGRLQGLFLAGRCPYQDPPQQHDLGWMDIPCPHCGALHWLAEKLRSLLSPCNSCRAWPSSARALPSSGGFQRWKLAGGPHPSSAGLRPALRAEFHLCRGWTRSGPGLRGFYCKLEENYTSVTHR